MIGFTWSLYSTKFEARGVRPINAAGVFCLRSVFEAVVHPSEFTLLGRGDFEVGLKVPIAGFEPALVHKDYEVKGGEVLWSLDDTVEMVAVCLILFSDDEHRKLLCVAGETTPVHRRV